MLPGPENGLHYRQPDLLRRTRDLAITSMSDYCAIKMGDLLVSVRFIG